MRTAIISDIHSNLQALEAAIADIDQQGVDRIVCLGDLVDYGANPKEVVEIVMNRCEFVLKGNHEEYVTSDSLYTKREPYAKSIKWTRNQLSQDELDKLSHLPLTRQEDKVLYAHATPEPGKENGRHISWFLHSEYQQDGLIKAFEAMKEYGTKICFIGHTHQQELVTKKRDQMRSHDFVQEYEAKRGEQVLVNVGSIGQPRGIMGGVGYAILEEPSSLRFWKKPRIYLRTFTYDVATAQQAIRSVEELDDKFSRQLRRW